MDAHRIVVVGGGLAGLTAAASLVRAGHAVTVLDGAEQVGGRGRTRTREGFAFNEGPHALYRAGGGLATLTDLGVRVHGARPRLHRAGVLVDGGVVRALTHLRRDVGDRGAVLRALAGRGGRLEEWVGRPASAWLEDAVSDPGGRATVASALRTSTYAADLDRVDAGAALAQLRTSMHGVLYLHGGWASLISELLRVVRARGGEVRTGAKVTSVHGDGGSFEVTLAHGGVLGAEAVVVAVGDASRTLGLLTGDATRRVAAATADVLPVRVAYLDVALIETDPSRRRRFPNVFGIDQPVYVAMQSDVADVAPSGRALVNVARYLRPEEERVEHRGELEAVLDVVEPQWRDRAVHARYAPCSLVAGDHPRPATCGTAGRVRPDVTGVPRLAVAGDWVGPAGTLADAAILSGRAAAHAVAADLIETSARGASTACRPRTARHD